MVIHQLIVRGLLVGVLLLSFSCDFIYTRLSENEISFYEDKTVGDLFRFPLLKPYKIISATNYSTKDWSIKLKNCDPYNLALEYSLTGIDSVLVRDNIIILHSYRTLYPGGSREAWALLVPCKNVECLFIEKKDLESKLEELNVSNKKLYPFKEVLEKFQEDGSLPWKEEIPLDCED